MVPIEGLEIMFRGGPVPSAHPLDPPLHNARLEKVSMLQNLHAHIQNVVFDNYNELLDELNKRQFLKPKGRPP